MFNTCCGRLPLGYDDFGEYALSPIGESKMIEVFFELLPDDIALCGTELYCAADYELPEDFSIDELVDRAREIMMTEYGDSFHFDIC